MTAAARPGSGLRAAFGFLTIAGGAAAPTPAALPWFGPIGALVGVAVGGAYWLGLELFTPLLAAVIAVLVDLVLTGLLHMDGLVDSGDGLLAPLERDRRLAVMKDPQAGAFGVVTVIVVLLLRVAALAASPAAPLAIAGVWALSRVVMAAVAAWVPYARAESGGGLASAFVGPSRVLPAALVASTVGALLLGAAGRGWLGVVAVVGCGLAAGTVVSFARHRLGGFTGDVLGAAGVIGETMALVMLAMR